jgi:hypothetical protein
MVVLDVLPVMLPGFIVHEPAGKPLNTTEPVEIVQSGCVICPTIGAAGTTGAALMCTLAEGAEVHEMLDTVNV